MIGMLQGVVRGRCVLVGGVGYLVSTPEPLPEGSEVELHVTTVVREDDISLYGFKSWVDQELFNLLRKAPSVGPQVALALLRDVGTNQVIGALQSGEHRLLTRAAGVGAKKAESIYHAIRDKVPADLLAAASDSIASSELRELVDTLEALGFDAEGAREAAGHALEQSPNAGEAGLLAAALAHLRGEG